MPYRKLLMVVAWVALALIVFSTLVPIDLRPHSGLPVQVERLVAFVGVGFLMALAYPRHIILCAVLVLGTAVMLEVLQLVTPSRHGRGIDLVAKLMGGTAGMFAAWAMHGLLERRVSNSEGKR